MLNQPEITKEKLAVISSDTLLIVGDNDMIKLSHSEYIKQTIPNSKLVTIANCDHFPFTNKNDEINNIISNFINS